MRPGARPDGWPDVRPGIGRTLAPTSDGGPSGREVDIALPVAGRAGADDVEPAVAIWRAASVARGREPTAARIARVREKLRDPDACLVVTRCGGVIVGMALAEPGRADEPVVPADRSLDAPAERTPDARLDGSREDLVDRLLYGHVSMLFVDPLLWSRGHGAALLEAIHQVASERGWTRTSVWTRVANVRARRVYERAGYGETGRVTLLGGAEPIVQYARPVGGRRAD